MFKNVINSISNIDNSKEGDYKNSEGLLVCGKCHTVKEAIFENPPHSGIMEIHHILCHCEEEKDKAQEKLKAQQKLQERITLLRKQGITNKAYLEYKFEKDDNRNTELTELCKNYVSQWESNKTEGNGIIFYGDTGGGKSFYACCIANQLIDIGVPVLVKRLSDLVSNRVDKNVQKINLESFDLIVLDDIGVENTTPTACSIIDDIYLARIPLIVTTNLTPNELKNPDTMDKKRIYDRILERCCFTQRVDVKISRLDMAKSKQREALSILNT